MKKYTFMQRKEDVVREWHHYDAEGQVLGKLATEIAKKLMGKEKITFTPHIDGGDFVVVTNASKIVEQPLALTETLDKFQVKVNVIGGGNAGQAGAIRHGIARALLLADETLKEALKEAGFLTRDSRMVERKKYGRRKARRSPQFSKR